MIGPLNPARQPKRTPQEKVDEILKTIRCARFSLGAFLFEVFRNYVSRSVSYGKTVGWFLGGEYPDLVLETWYKSPGLKIFAGHPLMYSTTTSYEKTKPIHPILTSFAAQITGGQLVIPTTNEIQKVPHPHNCPPVKEGVGDTALLVCISVFFVTV